MRYFICFDINFQQCSIAKRDYLSYNFLENNIISYYLATIHVSLIKTENRG